MDQENNWKSYVNDWTLMAGTAIATIAASGVIAAAIDPILGIEPWWFVMMSGVGYFANSFRAPIRANQMGVRDIFGNITDEVGPGLHFAPRGIFNLTPLPINQIERQFPGEREEIYYGDADLPEGKKWPIKMPFRPSETNEVAAKGLIGEKDWDVLDLHKLTSAGVDWRGKTIVEPDEIERVEIGKVKNRERGNVITFRPFVPKESLSENRIESELFLKVVWQITDAKKFLQTTEGGEEVGTSIDFVNKILEDEMVSVLTRLLPQMSYTQALQNINWINAHLFYAIHKRTLVLGIKVVTAFILQPETPTEVSQALASAAAKPIEAKAEAARIATIGGAEAGALKKRLAAEASGEKARLVATADGLAAISSGLNVSGADALAAETASKLAGGGNVIVAGGAGMRDLLALVAAGKKTAAKEDSD